jgi:response regulator RpfG family c-di-GMP phosphodiesterase
MTTDKKEDPIEILVIDSDRISVVLIHIFFDQVIDNYNIVDFGSPADALKYLGDTTDTGSKIILLETFTAGWQDFSFLDKYPLLKRNDFVYIVSVSTWDNDISKCLSHKFVRKYITKPIDTDDVTNIANELKLTVKGADNTV